MLTASAQPSRSMISIAARPIRRFPVAFVCLAGLGGYTMSIGHMVIGRGAILVIEAFLVLALLLIGMFLGIAGKLYAEHRDWPERRANLASLIAISPLVLIPLVARTEIDNWLWRLMTFVLPAAIVLVSVAPFLARASSNDAFWRFNAVTYLGFGIGLCGGLGAAIAAFLALYLLQLHLGYVLTGRTVFDAIVICLVFLSGWVALSWIPQRASEPVVDYASVWVGYAVSGLMVPIALLMLLFVNVYGQVIFWGLALTTSNFDDWNLPRGHVASLVCLLIGFCVLTHMLTIPWRTNGPPWVRLFYRFLPLLLIVPVGMLFIAAGQRIAAYGVTGERYFLMLIAVWTTFFVLYFLAQGRHSFVPPTFLAILLLLAAGGPWGAGAVSARSQAAILEELLVAEGLLVDGRIEPAEKNPDAKTTERIGALFLYLAKTGKLRVTAPWFQGTGVKVEEVGTIADNMLTKEMLAAMGLAAPVQDSAELQREKNRPVVRFRVPETKVVDVTGFDLVLDLATWERETLARFAPDADHYFVVEFENESGVLTVSAKDHSRVEFDLGGLAESLRREGFADDGPLTVPQRQRLSTALSLDARSGPLHARLHVERLSGSLLAGWVVDVSAKLTLLLSHEEYDARLHASD